MNAEIKVGQSIRVNMGRRGGIQAGTVTKILPDGRIQWVNACNFSRTANPSQITTKPIREPEYSEYIKAWMVVESEDE